MLCSKDSGLFSTGGIGGGGGGAVSSGKYGCGAAEKVYFQRFWRMLVDNCGLKSQPPSDCLVRFHGLMSFPWGKESKGGYFRTV